MGIILCPRHGRQSIAFVCPHLSDALLKQDVLPSATTVSADLDFDDLKMTAWLCRECLTRAALDGGGIERFGGGGMDWFFGLKKDPVCSSCLADAQGALRAPNQAFH